MVNYRPQKITTEKFISKAKNIYGERYDYTLTNYTGCNDDIEVICPKHGKFKVKAKMHVNKYQVGCNPCLKENVSQSIIHNFMDAAKKIHGSKYDYSKSKFSGCEESIAIICPHHGNFHLTKEQHIRHKIGCKKCENDKILNEFIKIKIKGENYSKEEIENIYITKEVPLTCKCCKMNFSCSLVYIKHYLKNPIRLPKYCSRECQQKSRPYTVLTTNCRLCGKEIKLKNRKKLRVPKPFCSYHCASKHLSMNKKYGTRRSKFEVWIEQQLTTLYPTLEIHFNRYDTVGRELDIFIPSLKLAFEINGVFHYKPIFGVEKLDYIRKNDDKKKAACEVAGIELKSIDISSLNKFKIEKADDFLKEIQIFIRERSPTFQ